MESQALAAALSKLDEESYHLIYLLYLAGKRKTEHEIAQESRLSQAAIHKQKKKILKTLKKLVIKAEKVPNRKRGKKDRCIPLSSLITKYPATE